MSDPLDTDAPLPMRRRLLTAGLAGVGMAVTSELTSSSANADPIQRKQSPEEKSLGSPLRCSGGNLNYQKESFLVADYDLWCLPRVPYYLRGPRCHFNEGTPRISYLGAAQVFGTFVKYPFPSLLGDMLSCETLNLGRGGAGPGFYTSQQGCLDYVNASNACVVQVMSARSSAVNSYMATTEGLASVELLHGTRKGEKILGHLALKELYKQLSKPEFLKMIDETRANYVQQYRELTARINVPKILLFIGRRPPLRIDDLGASYDAGLGSIMGVHPHLISESIMSDLSGLFDAVVEVSDEEGSSSRLMNRFTGGYMSIQRRPEYTVRSHKAYASPYLHTRAAVALYDELKGVV